MENPIGSAVSEILRYRQKKLTTLIKHQNFIALEKDTLISLTF